MTLEVDSMENNIHKEDEQLVVAYKEYRTYNDPDYLKSNSFMEKNPRFAYHGSDGTKQFFDTYYSEHIKNGNLILADMEEKPIVDFSGLGGRFLIRLTPTGIKYVETTYPFLV